MWWLLALAALPAAYGLHRLALWLEARGHLYYWHRQPGGGGYNPLHEIIEPTVRHAAQVSEQRQRGTDDGAPPDDRPTPEVG